MFAMIAGFLILGTVLICLEAEPADAAEVNKVEVTNCYYLNVHEDPATNSPVIGTFKSGEETKVYAKEDGWLNVKYGNQKGYIWKNYVEPITNNTGGEKLNYPEDKDLYWLAHIINAEAPNQPFKGKIAVGNVVLNRVEYKWFPDTVKDVIFQYIDGVPQFSPVENGTVYNEPSKQAIKAARMALNGKDVVSDEALYFWATYVDESNWVWTRNIICRIGTHVFAK